MAVPVEEAIAALSTFSLEDDQPEVQGPAVWVSSDRGATTSPIEYSDVAAYRLSLSEDTKALNQLNTLIHEGKEMSSVLYTYRSCIKALAQLPDSMKHSQAELYLETYQVLDLEMSRLREIQRWQASAASKLAADMQRFSRPERRINGPTVTHLWSMLKLLDVLVQLDHLKNAKASIPNDFSWYKRTFTQVSVQWQDTDSMREELDDLQIFLSTRWAILLNLHVEMFRVNNVEDILQALIVFTVESLELDFALLFPDRHVLLRVLPVLVVLATTSEKDTEALYKRVRINRLIGIFKSDPVIPAFPDLHLSPAAIMKELSSYFPKFVSQARLLALPAPHELQPREAQDYQRQYLIVNHISAIRAEHDDFTVRFASSINQLDLLKSTEGAEVEWSKDVKGNMYDMVVEGFQLLRKWTGRVWEQCAWKFSRPCKDQSSEESNNASTLYSDYEKVVRYNYSAEERRALVELVGYVKSIGSMMQRCDTLVADALWETIHAEVQDFVQNTLATMLRTTFRRKKDLSRILSDMRTLSADWMANTSKQENDLPSLQQEGEESKGSYLYPRPAAPTAAQVHCLQFLIYEVVSGGNLRKPGGLFSNTGSDIPAEDLKQLETFFYKLGFFLHVLDYTVTIATLTDLGFLWFREFYLETSRVIQFPIECSLPWMLVDYVLESQNAGLFESVVMPFDIYNDASQQALTVLKQRFLYDEIEAEVDHCFDIFVSKLCEIIFTYYKSWAARELLDSSFLFAVDNGEKYSVQPMRFNALLKMTRVKLLGRSIDLRCLISQRMNKAFRENLEFLFDRFESQDICAIVELENLVNILKHAHKLLSEDLTIDSFSLIFSEMQENISLVSYSSRLAYQIWTEMQNDFLPNFILCNTTQRFVRSPKSSNGRVQKPSMPYAKPNFYCGNQDLNSAHQSFTRLHNGFFGMPHMFSIVRLLGTRSLPWLIRALLDHISNKISSLEAMITGLQEALPKSIGLLPFDGGVTGCMRHIKEKLNWASKAELKQEVLQGIKEIGSTLYWMGLLDIVLREIDTTRFMQLAPWLGFIPNADGQILLSQGEGESPVVNLMKSTTTVIVSNPNCSNSTSFYTMSKQAEAAGKKTPPYSSLLLYDQLFMDVKHVVKILKAYSCYLEALRIQPTFAVAWSNLAGLFMESGDLNRALHYYKEAVKLKPSFPDAYLNLGNVYKALGMTQEAVTCYQHALQARPNYAMAFGNLASSYYEQGQLDLAILHYKEAINCDPGFLEAYNNLGNALKDVGRVDEAIQCYNQCLSLQPHHPQALTNLGNIYMEWNMVAVAATYYKATLSVTSGLSAPFNNLAVIYKQQGNYADAISCYNEVLRIDPMAADGLVNRGNTYKELGRVTEALQDYINAINIRPTMAEAHANLASAYKDSGHVEAAIKSYKQALQLRPDFPEATCNLLHTLQCVCSWEDKDKMFAEVEGIIKRQIKMSVLPSVQPFHAIAYPLDPALALEISRKYAQHCSVVASRYALSPFKHPQPIPVKSEGGYQRLRVGYVSSDFGNHPLSHLMGSVFGMHNREHVEVFCYALSPNDGTEWRQRTQSEAEHFVDVSAMSSDMIAKIINEDNIQILVNLNGYTKGARNEIFAMKPAPIQVSYMGFPGTMGASYIDYLVTDEFVSPFRSAHIYSEKLVHLPHCYFVNDYKQKNRDLLDPNCHPKRSDYGLPEDKFLFACFNQLYKMDPEIFTAWCNILKSVPNSALWLLKFPAAGESRLRVYAAAQGVGQDQLIFTDVAVKNEHIRRSTLADLFLDTPLCNGHTTGTDILWAGLPMITLPLEKMATRVAGSLCLATGLGDEMIVNSIEEYEERAISLALNPSKLQALRNQLKAVRLTCPLFDTTRWVKNLDRAFFKMWNLYCTDKHPQPFKVTEYDMDFPFDR